MSDVEEVLRVESSPVLKGTEVENLGNGIMVCRTLGLYSFPMSQRQFNQLEKESSICKSSDLNVDNYNYLLTGCLLEKSPLGSWDELSCLLIKFKTRNVPFLLPSSLAVVLMKYNHFGKRLYSTSTFKSIIFLGNLL